MDRYLKGAIVEGNERELNWEVNPIRERFGDGE